MHTQKIRSKLKSTTAACPVLGLVPAVPRAGRPPVLGLVARQGGPAPLLLFLGVCSPHGRLGTDSHSGAFLLNQQVSCLTGDTSSYEIPGVLRLSALPTINKGYLDRKGKGELGSWVGAHCPRGTKPFS